MKDLLLERGKKLEQLLKEEKMLLHNYVRKSLDGIAEDIDCLIHDHFDLYSDSIEDEQTYQMFNEILWGNFFEQQSNLEELAEIFSLETTGEEDKLDKIFLKRKVVRDAVKHLRTFSIHELFEDYSDADDIFFNVVDNAIYEREEEIIKVFGKNYTDTDEYNDWYNECIQDTIGNQ